MKRVLLILPLMFTTACVTAARTTTEYDSAAQVSANYWTGLFFVIIAGGAALGIVAWAVAYAISEHAKYGNRKGDR